MEWKNIVRLDELKLEAGETEKPYLYESNRPATDMGAKKLGFNVSTIPPGQFSCPYQDKFDICEYPDSGKALSYKLKKLFDLNSSVDYFKGETDPAAHWPKELLRK